jgi:hypothetical protein
MCFTTRFARELGDTEHDSRRRSSDSASGLQPNANSANVLPLWRARSNKASLSCSPNQERWGEFVLPFRRRRVYATSPWFSPLRASVSPVVQFRVPVPVCFIWTTHRPLLRARRALILAQISCLHPSRRYLLPVAGKESPVLYPYPFSPSPEREFLSFFHH